MRKISYILFFILNSCTTYNVYLYTDKSGNEVSKTVKKSIAKTALPYNTDSLICKYKWNLLYTIKIGLLSSKVYLHNANIPLWFIDSNTFIVDKYDLWNTNTLNDTIDIKYIKTNNNIKYEKFYVDTTSKSGLHYYYDFEVLSIDKASLHIKVIDKKGKTNILVFINSELYPDYLINKSIL